MKDVDGAFEYDGPACGLVCVTMALMGIEELRTTSARHGESCPHCGHSSCCSTKDMSLLDSASAWAYSLALASAGTTPQFDELTS